MTNQTNDPTSSLHNYPRYIRVLLGLALGGFLFGIGFFVAGFVVQGAMAPLLLTSLGFIGVGILLGAAGLFFMFLPRTEAAIRHRHTDTPSS